MSASPIVAEVRGLTVSYGSNIALDDISVRIPRGRTLVIGPNGSGKTSLLNVLAGIVRPRRGYVRVLGLNPFRDSGRLYRRIMYVRDADYIPYTARVETYARLLAEAYGRDRVEEALRLLGLDRHVKKRYSELSRGLRRRLAMLEALAARRELVLVDEPFSGLDSESRIVISRVLGEVSGSLIVASHIPPATCFDYLIVIEGGRISYAGGYSRELAENYFRLAMVGQ